MRRLVITNGDSAAEILVASGYEATILPWRDALHEGPLLTGPLDACSTVRAPWLAARFGLEATDVAENLADRDTVISGIDAFDVVELWFEHDLYDQLQLAQIIVALGHDAPMVEDIRLIQADDFLGHRTPSTILEFRSLERPLTEDDRVSAVRAWSALTANTPERVAEFVSEPADGPEPLPFLRSALHRFLCELPDPTRGLGLSEWRIVSALADGERKFGALFRDLLEQEEAAFLGDLSFFLLVRDLAACDHPVVTLSTGNVLPEDFGNTTVGLTDFGRAVLEGRADQLAENRIDRWWGGTHLMTPRVWRYDRETAELAPPGAVNA